MLNSIRIYVYTYIYILYIYILIIYFSYFFLMANPCESQAFHGESPWTSQLPSGSLRCWAAPPAGSRQTALARSRSFGLEMAWQPGTHAAGWEAWGDDSWWSEISSGLGSPFSMKSNMEGSIHEENHGFFQNDILRLESTESTARLLGGACRCILDAP